MLPLQPRRDAADDSWTQLGIVRKLDGDVAQEWIAVARL
jgi:hypothetical protein